MQKKVTISMDEAVYDGLSRLVGRGKISKFIEGLVRPHVSGDGLRVNHHLEFAAGKFAVVVEHYR